MTTKDQERQLIERAVAGDSKAFEALLRPYQPKMKQLLRGYFKHSGEAEDALQEVLIRIFRGLPKFRGDSKFSTWIYTVTSNTARNEFAKNKRHRYTDIDECGDVMDALQAPYETEATVDGRRDLERLSEALAQMHPRLSEALLLHDVHNKSCAEIAELQSVPEGTVRGGLFRAREALRAQGLAPD